VGLFGIADRLTPHLHFISGLEGPPSRLQRVWLLILAMTLHNLPEGLAVGVAFGREDIAAAVIIAIGIGIQNMPEGLTVALPLVREGYRPARAIGWATLTGLAEPVTALIGRRWWCSSGRSCRSGWLLRPAACSTSRWTRSCRRATAAGTTWRRQSGRCSACC
jgi:zinc transporter ZupT